MVTIAAVYRSSRAWLERDLSFLAAFAAGYRIKLAGGWWGKIIIVCNSVSLNRTFGFSGRSGGTAGRATFRGMVKAFGMKRLLLISRESISSSTIKTDE